MTDFIRQFDDIINDIVGKNESVTYVAFVMDHSGSMRQHSEQSIENFNKQLEKLKSESDDSMQTFVFVVDFDDEIDVKKAELVEDIKPIKDYWIGGMTALHDGISKGIGLIEKLMAKDPREDKAALVIVQTDGHENASKEFGGQEGRDMINKRIKELEETGNWTFAFLAEGVDKELGTGLGFNATFSYDKSSSGLAAAQANTVNAVAQYYTSRKMGNKSVTNFFNSVDDSSDNKDIANDNNSNDNT